MDECDYHCMWHTVEEMIQHHRQVPQFHGKVSPVCVFVCLLLIVGETASGDQLSIPGVTVIVLVYTQAVNSPVIVESRN